VSWKWFVAGCCVYARYRGATHWATAPPALRARPVRGRAIENYLPKTTTGSSAWAPVSERRLPQIKVPCCSTLTELVALRPFSSQVFRWNFQIGGAPFPDNAKIFKPWHSTFNWKTTLHFTSTLSERVSSWITWFHHHLSPSRPSNRPRRPSSNASPISRNHHHFCIRRLEPWQSQSHLPTHLSDRYYRLLHRQLPHSCGQYSGSTRLLRQSAPCRPYISLLYPISGIQFTLQTITRWN